MARYALVQAGFGAPRRQNRWKVAFRYILAIPLIVWVFLRSIAVVVLVIIGWFGALLMGHLPQRIARALSNYLIYQTRVNSYLYLMNDTYPPVSTTAEFDVNLEIPVSTVRRWAVLFRFIMLIPANLVNGLVTVGLSISSVFIWLIVLVKGEMPLPLFGAVAAVLRFSARTSAYALMLTGKYPGELFGEKPLATEGLSERLQEATSPELPTAETPESATMTAPVAADTMTSQVTSEAPDDEERSEAPGAPTGSPTIFPSSESSSDGDPPRTARLVLSQGSKRILVIFIILGVLGWAADGVIYAKVLSNVGSLTSLENANNELAVGVNAAKAQSASCTLGQNVCLQQYYRQVSNDFYVFEGTVSLISFPASARTDASRLLEDSAAFYSQLQRMSAPGTTITQAETNRLETAGNNFDTAYAQLVSDLSPSI